MKKIANIWMNFAPQSFIECHPYFIEHKMFESINLVNNILDNGKKVDAFTQYRSIVSMNEYLATSLLDRAIHRALRFWQEWRFNSFLIEKMKTYKPNLIFVHFGNTAAQVLPVLKKFQAPAVAIFYGSDASSSLQSKYWVRKYQAMFPHLKKIIVLCEPVKERLAQIGCPREKIYVWNMPAGIEKYPYRSTTPTDKTHFVICARFIEKKGHYILLQAFKKILEQGRKADLTIIGYGNGKNKIQEQVNALGLSEDVKIIDTAAQGDFAKFYYEELKTKDIFVLPSTTAKNGDDEGGPALTLVCAQSAGMPVICTPFPGSEISVKEGETGLYCKDADINSLREKMLLLMDHPEEWGRLGKNASDFVKKEFSEKTQIEKMRNEFNELILSSSDT